MAEKFDIVIVGGGMAGVSLGAALAASRRVLLLEREEQPGMHATGRSAALYAPGYGKDAIRALTEASRDAFFDAVEEATPLVRPRATMLVATAAQRDSVGRSLQDHPGLFELLEEPAARALVPIFRPGVLSAALLDHSSADIDVDALLQRYLRSFKAHGGALAGAEAPIVIEPGAIGWRIETATREIEAAILVDAAGAWADQVAATAGLSPIGLMACRRTAALVDAPAIDGFADWPAVIDIEERFYFKPDAGKLLVSPAEETPVEPHDAFADDETLAEGIDRISQLTSLEVIKMPLSWAGLRTFAPDRVPVIGFDPQAPAPFFWLAGQGGYGIQTAPAAAALAAALITGVALPPFAGTALVTALSPDRFR